MTLPAYALEGTHVPASDTDADSLSRRAARLHSEIDAFIGECLRTRDQHAARVDLLAAEVAELRRSERELRADLAMTREALRKAREEIPPF